MDNQYWPAAPLEEIASKIEEAFENHQKWLSSTGYGDRISTAYRAYYGFDKEGSLRITRDSDEVARIRVNHYRSLVRRLLILVTEAKLSWETRSKSTDSKSQIQADLGRGVVEYFGDSRNMNGILSDAVERSLIQLSSWVWCPWDATLGYELSVENGQIIRSGDQKFEVLGPFDVAHSTSRKESPWYVIRTKVGKHDEAVLHPEFADEILGASLDYDTSDPRYTDQGMSQDESDECCWKYTLYHSRTPAMPEGRLVEVIAGQVLSDRKLGYDKIPLFQITAGDVIGTCFGDSPAIDLLPLQEAIDALFSGTVTNNLNNATQLIYSQDPNLTTRRLADGQILVSATNPPQALNLTGSSAENYKMLDLLTSSMGLLSGVNDVARGNPSASLKSGTSLAIIMAQAISFCSNLQKSYARLAGDVGTQLIENLRMFGTEEMTAYITGVSRKGQIKKFRAKDLMDIERVTVDLGSPLTQTMAGRAEMVQAWTQQGILKDPAQIVTFLRTGQIESVTEDTFGDSILIREENEMIRAGKTPIVLLTDLHSTHILGHREITSSPEVREDPIVLAAWTAHIQSHIDEMRNVPPDLAAVLSGQALPPPPSAMPTGSGNEPLPTVDGARMPNVPPGTPPQVAENYDQALQAIPAEPVQ